MSYIYEHFYWPHCDASVDIAAVLLRSAEATTPGPGPGPLRRSKTIRT